MGLVHKENLAVVPSEFRRLSIQRVMNISEAMQKVYGYLNCIDDPDYHKLASELNSIKLAVGQVEYSFEEIAKFLESLSDKVDETLKQKENAQ